MFLIDQKERLDLDLLMLLHLNAFQMHQRMDQKHQSATNEAKSSYFQLEMSSVQLLVQRAYAQILLLLWKAPQP